MEKKDVSIITFSIIIVIIAITCGVIGWMLAKKSDMPKKQDVSSYSDVVRVDSEKQNGKTDWQTFDSTVGFSFEYPKNWSCNEVKEANVVVSIGCSDIERQKEYDAFPEKRGGAAYYKNNLDINLLKFASLEDYVNDPTMEQLGDTMIGNKNAREVIVGGYGANYGVATTFNDEVLELSFLAASKKEIGNIERHIISSFKFTK